MNVFVQCLHLVPREQVCRFSSKVRWIGSALAPPTPNPKASTEKAKQSNGEVTTKLRRMYLILWYFNDKVMFNYNLRYLLWYFKLITISACKITSTFVSEKSWNCVCKWGKLLCLWCVARLCILNLIVKYGWLIRLQDIILFEW